jgi:hypothetical protein
MKLVIKLNNQQATETVKGKIELASQKGANFTAIESGKGKVFKTPEKTYFSKFNLKGTKVSEGLYYIPTGGASYVSLKGNVVTFEGTRGSIRQSGVGPAFWLAKELVETGEATVVEHQSSDTRFEPWDTLKDVLLRQDNASYEEYDAAYDYLLRKTTPHERKESLHKALKGLHASFSTVVASLALKAFRSRFC